MKLKDFMQWQNWQRANANFVSQISGSRHYVGGMSEALMHTIAQNGFSDIFPLVVNKYDAARTLGVDSAVSITSISVSGYRLTNNFDAYEELEKVINQFDGLLIADPNLKVKLREALEEIRLTALEYCGDETDDCLLQFTITYTVNGVEQSKEVNFIDNMEFLEWLLYLAE